MNNKYKFIPRLTYNYLYFRWEKDGFDYYGFVLYWPFIKKTYMDECYEDGGKTYEVSFDSGLKYIKTNCYKGLTIKVLGFGISINRQWGY